MAKIAVVGPIPRDTIHTHKGEVIKKYGCITHPTIALARLLDDNDDAVIPIAHIHQQDKDAIATLLKSYKNISNDGVRTDLDQGTIIELKFIDQNNRIEKQKANMAPIKPEDVTPFLDSDCFVFVPITDFEIELNTLKHIKANSNATIVFDAHGPTTFVNENGDRLRQFWRDKEDWFPVIDILKMNLEESQCCWFDKDYSTIEFDEDDTSHLDDFASYALNKGIQILYITLDSRGCAVYYKNNGVIIKDFIKSVPVSNVIDTTGCGDSFAGGLAYGYTKYNDPIKAGQYANILGALRTQGKDFSVFKSKTKTEAIRRENYQ